MITAEQVDDEKADDEFKSAYAGTRSDQFVHLEKNGLGISFQRIFEVIRMNRFRETILMTASWFARGRLTCRPRVCPSTYRSIRQSHEKIRGVRGFVVEISRRPLILAVPTAQTAILSSKSRRTQLPSLFSKNLENLRANGHRYGQKL